MPSFDIVQLVHLLCTESIDETLIIFTSCRWDLIGFGEHQVDSEKLGGTGCKHNWRLSKDIREKVKIPAILAGGLNSVNVLEGIRHV